MLAGNGRAGSRGRARIAARHRCSALGGRAGSAARRTLAGGLGAAAGAAPTAGTPACSGAAAGSVAAAVTGMPAGRTPETGSSATLATASAANPGAARWASDAAPPATSNAALLGARDAVKPVRSPAGRAAAGGEPGRCPTAAGRAGVTKAAGERWIVSAGWCGLGVPLSGCSVVLAASRARNRPAVAGLPPTGSSSAPPAGMATGAGCRAGGGASACGRRASRAGRVPGAAAARTKEGLAGTADPAGASAASTAAGVALVAGSTGSRRRARNAWRRRTDSAAKSMPAPMAGCRRSIASGARNRERIGQRRSIRGSEANQWRSGVNLEATMAHLQLLDGQVARRGREAWAAPFHRVGAGELPRTHGLAGRVEQGDRAASPLELVARTGEPLARALGEPGEEVVGVGDATLEHQVRPLHPTGKLVRVLVEAALGELLDLDLHRQPTHLGERADGQLVDGEDELPRERRVDGT